MNENYSRLLNKMRIFNFNEEAFLSFSKNIIFINNLCTRANELYEFNAHL